MGKTTEHAEPSTRDYSFSGYIRLDNLKMQTTRTAYTFISWLALVGGSLKSVKIICMFFVTEYVKRDFMNNVLGALFLVKKFDDNKDEVDCGGPVEEHEETDKNHAHLLQSTTDIVLDEPGPSINFCTANERKNYGKLKIELRKNNVTKQNINHIIIAFLKHRAPFNTVVSNKDLIC